MNNTILSSKNTFSEGLIMDFAPDNTQSNCMTSALNATLLTFNGNEMSLQNDMGNGRVETARLPEGYIPVGTCEFGDIIYIVSYNPILNKSLIGCFPSPERNISSEETDDIGLTLSSADFQELIGEKPTGKLKATSVKKILYSSKNMNSGDKYIIYSENLANNSEYLSDYGNLSHQHETFPKLVKIHVVSIEESGKIIYLDSTTKWYDNDYYINGDGQKTAEGKLDIDSYRTLVSSAYSIFSSKVSGKLALLIELEKITGFSCSWEPYIANYSTKDGIDYVHYAIYWNFNWTTNDNNINPNGALLLKSELSGQYSYLDNSFNLLKNDIAIPGAVLDKGPSIKILRKYKPEDNISYEEYIKEYQYDIYLKETLKEYTNPYKLNILIDTDKGLPKIIEYPEGEYIGEYYINCNEVNEFEKVEKVEELNSQKSKKTTKSGLLTSENVIAICGDSGRKFKATNTEIYKWDNQDNPYKLIVKYRDEDNSDEVIFTINDIDLSTDGDRFLYAVGKIQDKFSLIQVIEPTSGNVNYGNAGIDEDNKVWYLPEDLGEITHLSHYKNELFLLSGAKGSFIYDIDKKEYYQLPFNAEKYYKEEYWRANKNKLYKYSSDGNLKNQYEFDKEIQSFYILGKNVYILYENEIYEYVIEKSRNGYTIKNGEKQKLEPIQLNDDIVNNYFNYPVIKPFTHFNNDGKISPFEFKIPVKQTIVTEDKAYVFTPDISNLIYNYKIAPTMPYGYLEEFAQEGTIDFSKIGKKNILLKTWKYYNYDNTTTLTWGMDAYTEPGKGISEVVFEFYDNQGLAAAHHVLGKNSYNGTFTEYLILNTNTSKLNNIDHNNTMFRHLGRKIKDVSESVAGKAYHCKGVWFKRSEIQNGVTYDEDDSGILYSNCLYLVKIIIKYCSKGTLNEYIESGNEYIIDYRWFWTNNLFNGNYHNTNDFKELLFKLNLNCITHLLCNDNYKVNQIKYIAPEQDIYIDNTAVYKTLSTTVQTINNDNKGKNNIKLSLTPGLINNYNTFNLNEDSVNDFIVTVFLGDDYIKQSSQELLFTENYISINDNLLHSISETYKKLQQPEIIYKNQKITITHPTSDVNIWYRYNEEVVFTEYKGPINLKELSHVKIIHTYAKKSGFVDSDIITYNIESETINARAFGQDEYLDIIIDGVVKDDENIFDYDDPIGDDSTPKIVIAPNIEYDKNSKTVTINRNTDDTTYITYYTTDNTKPQLSNNRLIYNGPFLLSNNKTNKIIINAQNYHLNNYSTMATKEIIFDDSPGDSPGDSQNNNIPWVFLNLSKNLYDLLGIEVSKSDTLDIYLNEDSYKNYKNRFTLTTNGEISNGQLCSNVGYTFHYQPSEGEYKSVDGLIGYQTDLSNLINGNVLYLTLTGIHYSKYVYTTIETKVSEVLRSFVLTSRDLDDYKISLLDELPYFYKMLVTTMGDKTWSNGLLHTSILTFSYDENKREDAYKITNISEVRVYDNDKNGSIPVLKGLEDFIGEAEKEFTFMFPFGYGVPENSGVNHNRAQIGAGEYDENYPLISNNSEYKIGEHWFGGPLTPNDDVSLLSGTIAGIKLTTDREIQPADNHLRKTDMLKECGEIVTGYLTQLFYLDASPELSVYNPHNFIYLKPNLCSYKKDIIINLEPRDTLLDHNDLILMRGIKYKDYISKVLTKAFQNKEIEDKFKLLSNVNLLLTNYILTAPLEYISDYISPDTHIEFKTPVDSVFEELPTTTTDNFSKKQIYGWDNEKKLFYAADYIEKLHSISKINVDTSTDKLKVLFKNNPDMFKLGEVSYGKCLDMTGDNKLTLKRFPTFDSGTYTIFTDNKYGLTGFKKFKLYERVDKDT